MKRLAVFCGSSNGASEIYKDGAIQLGKELVKRGITLVYGGASVGIMGKLANTVLEEGGQVIGVIPKMLEDREISHPNLTELIVVNSMHERKAKMAELADGFIALPGGPGTLEEFFEVFTWSQIGLHTKPCGLLNINHYYDHLISLFNHMTQEEFLQEKYRTMTLVDTLPGNLIQQFYAYEPPTVKTYSKNS
ncbi:TIGR00730 family Rossman fold protein [Priestia sp. YIM B13446]|uniref:LOG family protein n=1 Tax=Priestia TaxID=2800373 RepID=UPI000BFE51C6|nr:TIGR00730 family Rossman fold protein [Priestia megaterium]MDH2449559.1 TIGR00730 family Rossman fold protein [Priestia megaterium]MDL5149017.1 TIGR00730 family Rossman fold protein [Priestia megaterium]PGN62182.1 TIGR00730 family Rossman fold protein [Priestia megaterium]